MSETDQCELSDHLHASLERVGAAEDLATYFCGPRTGSARYTGRWFERLDGGGDQASCRDHFTAGDLLAVEMLSVQVPGEVAIQILHGLLGDRLAKFLSEIPVDVGLGDAGAYDLLAPDSAAARAWGVLQEQTGVNWVTAGKLLARKRPRLIPIYDAVVRCALRRPANFWTALHLVWSADGSRVPALVADLRGRGMVPEEVSDLRVMDVVIWMGHHDDHRRGLCGEPA